MSSLAHQTAFRRMGGGEKAEGALRGPPPSQTLSRHSTSQPPRWSGQHPQGPRLWLPGPIARNLSSGCCISLIKGGPCKLNEEAEPLGALAAGEVLPPTPVSEAIHLRRCAFLASSQVVGWLQVQEHTCRAIWVDASWPSQPRALPTEASPGKAWPT